MCPSTEVSDPQHAFATEVLRKLLHHIHAHNSLADADRGHYTFLVSHAWTDGPMIYVVYTAPPSNVSGDWSATPECRLSIRDPGQMSMRQCSFTLLDFEENWPRRFSRQAGGPDAIQWRGRLHPGLPERLSSVAEAHRYTPSLGAPSTERSRAPDQHVAPNPDGTATGPSRSDSPRGIPRAGRARSR